MKKTLQDIENWRKVINAIKQDNSEEDAFKLDDLKCKEAEDKPKHQFDNPVLGSLSQEGSILRHESFITIDSSCIKKDNLEKLQIEIGNKDSGPTSFSILEVPIVLLDGRVLKIRDIIQYTDSIACDVETDEEGVPYLIESDVKKEVE